MYPNLFFLKYYIAYASVLLSEFHNHPVLFLVVAVCFTTIETNIRVWSYGDWFSVIRSITAYNYLSVLNSLLHSRFSRDLKQLRRGRKRERNYDVACSRTLGREHRFRRENWKLSTRVLYKDEDVNKWGSNKCWF